MNPVVRVLQTLGFFVVGVVACLTVLVLGVPLMLVSDPLGFLRTVRNVGGHVVETLLAP